MKLYLVHCGYYDSETCDGVYENHVNLFVVAESFQQARSQAKEHPLFRKKQMHVDGLQELEAVQGYRIALELDLALEGRSQIQSSRYRSVLVKTPSEPSLH